MSETAISYRLEQLTRAVEIMRNEQGQLNQSVLNVAAGQDATRNELNDLRIQFAAYMRRDELARNLQLAQTQIIAVRQELETGYGHYADVRRQATGVLQAMDAGIVTRSTIYQLSEELMISTPRYWLAPALVALAAWIQDEPQLARRALAEAVRRDNDKTSLFFALVLRRHSRTEATARWLRQYVARQDAGALSREFTVVLDAVATGALGAEARPVVLDDMTTWYDRLRADRKIVDSQVTRWRQLIAGMRTPMNGRFKVLPEISPSWPTLKAVYEGATVQASADAYFRDIFDGPLDLSEDLRRRVDDILASLVTNFDDDEAPLRRREAQLQATIDHGGDTDAAQQALAAQAPVQAETVDFLTLITNAAFFPDKVGASRGTQRLAIVLAREWIVEASGQLEATNVAALPATVDLSFDGWSGRIDGRSTEDGLVASVASHVDMLTERAAAQVSPAKAVVAAIGCGLALLLALTILISGGGGGGVFFLLVAAAAGGTAGYLQSQVSKRREQIRAAGEQRKAAAAAKVRGAVAEAVDWRSSWEAQLPDAARFRGFMETLVRDAYIATAPDQRRKVLS